MSREIPNLKCPKCGGVTGIRDSRPNQDQDAIRRRRACARCGYRFTTYEVPVIEGISPQGLVNLFATMREALDAMGNAILLAQSKLDAAKANLSAVEHANDLISGKKNATPAAH